MIEITSRQAGRPAGTTKQGVRLWMTEEEVARFFRQVARSLQWRVVFNLALHLALRVSEVVALRVDDFDQPNKIVTVRPVKRGRPRHYQGREVPAELWQLVARWLKARPAQDGNPWLFPHRDKPGEHMSVDGVKFAFKAACRKAGLSSEFSIHSLRHTKAHQLAELGQSAYEISAWLRQRSTSSADEYVRAFDGRRAGIQAGERARVY